MALSIIARMYFSVNFFEYDVLEQQCVHAFCLDGEPLKHARQEVRQVLCQQTRIKGCSRRGVKP